MTPVQTDKEIERNPCLKAHVTETKLRMIKVVVQPDAFTTCHFQFEFLRRPVASDHRRHALFDDTQITDGPMRDALLRRNLVSHRFLVEPAAVEIMCLYSKFVRPPLATCAYIARNTHRPVLEILQQNTPSPKKPPKAGLISQPSQRPAKANPIQTSDCTKHGILVQCHQFHSSTLLNVNSLNKLKEGTTISFSLQSKRPLWLRLRRARNS